MPHADVDPNTLPTTSPTPGRREDLTVMVRATRVRRRVIEEVSEQALFVHPQDTPPYSDRWVDELADDRWVVISDRDVEPPTGEIVTGVVVPRNAL
jgi:hypothetical protein